MQPNAVTERLRLLRQRGLLDVPPPGRTGKRKPYSDEQVLSLARAGLRRSQIVRQLGISVVTVTRRLRALRAQGLLPGPWAWIQSRDRRLAELRQTGLSLRAIAARTGMSYLTVWKCLDRLRRRTAPAPGPAQPSGAGA